MQMRCDAGVVVVVVVVVVVCLCVVVVLGARVMTSVAVFAILK
jgi:hypothetical protein